MMFRLDILDLENRLLEHFNPRSRHAYQTVKDVYYFDDLAEALEAGRNQPHDYAVFALLDGEREGADVQYGDVEWVEDRCDLFDEAIARAKRLETEERLNS